MVTASWQSEVHGTPDSRVTVGGHRRHIGNNPGYGPGRVGSARGQAVPGPGYCTRQGLARSPLLKLL